MKDILKLGYWLFGLTSLAFLVFTLFWSLSTLNAISDNAHNKEMERLELSKEIALINLNASKGTIIKDYECEFRILQAKNFLYEDYLYKGYVDYANIK